MCKEDLASGTLKTETMRNCIRIKYKKMQRLKNKEDTKEVALFTKKQFKGACDKCGKTGHKSVDCFDQPKNADKKKSWLKDMKKKRNQQQKGNSNNKNG